MTRCFCWNVARDGHQPDCPVGREQARERATSDRLLADVQRALPGLLVVDLRGWTEAEARAAWGDR